VPAGPRKLIWVLGEASGVPGWGETAIGPAAAALAEVSSSAGLAGDVLPHALRPMHITSATGSTVTRILIDPPAT
jgi:hypothetical protein